MRRTSSSKEEEASAKPRLTEKGKRKGLGETEANGG